MKLFTKCSRCKNEIKIKSNASTRTELEMELGETFLVTCDNCGTKKSLDVKAVKAKTNLPLILGGLGLGLLVTVLFWKSLGAIGVATFAIPMIIWKQQQHSIKAFNNYRRRNY